MSRYQKIDMHVGPVLIEGRLAKHELCACGFPYISKHAVYGKPYIVDAKSVRWAKFRCGHCGCTFPTLLIDVWEKDITTGLPFAMWFPLECLDLFEAMKKNLPPMLSRWEPVHKNRVPAKQRKPGVLSVQ